MGGHAKTTTSHTLAEQPAPWDRLPRMRSLRALPQAYIVENPSSVKTLCFLIGLILMIFSILGVINPFGAFSRPGEYLANIYNVFFGDAWLFMRKNGTCYAHLSVVRGHFERIWGF